MLFYIKLMWDFYSEKKFKADIFNCKHWNLLVKLSKNGKLQAHKMLGTFLFH